MTIETQHNIKPTVFFDGGCPLCAKEIRHYRRLDKAKQLRWLDIHQHSEQLKRHKIALDRAMARLHCLDAKGNTVTGVAAFLLIWRQLPYYHHLASIIRICHLESPLEFAYRHFAAWRYKRRCDKQFRIELYRD